MNDRLIVIDAYSQIFRMFHGIRGNLKSADGLPTNAIYGIARLLFTLDKEFPADYAAVAFDKGKCKIRCELQSDYKATRKPMPEELREQIPFIEKWFEFMGWNPLVTEGVEADDIIGAVVTKSGVGENLILSSDKDLMQLVNESVLQLVPGKQNTFKRFDIEAVTEKFGVRPDQVLDYLSIVGDAVDNIPGIKGVGPKTAAKLLNQFGSIDGMYADLAGISKENLRTKVAEASDQMVLNRKMVALYPDSFDYPGTAALKRKRPQLDKLFELAVELNFKSILKDIEELIEKEKSPTLFDF